MYTCSDCYKAFTRSDNMTRHWKQMHERINEAYPPPPPPPPPPPLPHPPPPPQRVPPPPQGVPPPQGGPPPSEESKDVVFQHPFTMMISGPTACGKTTMVKDILQNHSLKIQPDIQRIVWLYKRWQPLYTIVQNTVVPNVESIKGIPSDLDDDDYFDARINNLLVVDYLYLESGKDKRVTDLFTEGSHHRSLSVISINQNLFGSKDPTQRRNCHYLVLFNNPVDKQLVMTLARQMYPGHCDVLLKQFTKATKNPFGYLLVDLKPFTPEEHRLKCGMSRVANTNQVEKRIGHVTPQETIKAEVLPRVPHSSVGIQTGHIEEETIMEKGQPCDDCGQLFDSVNDVQRHVKSGWCPENREQKKRKYDDSSDNEQDDSVEDNEAYVQLWKRARECNDNKFDKMYNTYIDSGENSNDAQEMAEERIQPFYEKDFFGKYTTLIDTYILPLRNSELHKEIMTQIDKLIAKGINATSAVTKVLRRHKNSFQDLFDMEFSDDEESVEEDDESEADDVSEEENV